MKFQNAHEMPFNLLQVNRTVTLNQRRKRLEWQPIVFSWCQVATGRDRQLCHDCRGVPCRAVKSRVSRRSWVSVGSQDVGFGLSFWLLFMADFGRGEPR